MTALVLVAASAAPGWAAPVPALDPAGRDAAPIADLFWWLAVGSAAVWLAAVGFLLYCLRPPLAGLVDAPPVAEAADLRVRVTDAADGRDASRYRETRA